MYVLHGTRTFSSHYMNKIKLTESGETENGIVFHERLICFSPKSEIHCIWIATLASTAQYVSLTSKYMCVLTVILRVVKHCLCPMLHLAGHPRPCVHYQTPVGGQLPQLDQGVLPTGQNVLEHTNMISILLTYSTINNSQALPTKHSEKLIIMRLIFRHVHVSIQFSVDYQKYLSKIYLYK